MEVFITLLSWIFHLSVSQYVTTTIPIIKDVSAMCSSESITASIDFDRPFSGKIYSLDYATVHDCIYYNSLDMDTVLFSIPAHRCGTKLSRTTRDMVDMMENRVYVQMDKDTQTAADKQFSFVCQLAEGRINNFSSNSIRRHPIASHSVHSDYVLSPVQAISTMNAKLRSPAEPSSVPRVSAFSSDAHFGNWPIPGAKPYSPGTKAVSSWPKQLAPVPIVPIPPYSRMPSTSLPNESPIHPIANDHSRVFSTNPFSQSNSQRPIHVENTRNPSMMASDLYLRNPIGNDLDKNPVVSQSSYHIPAIVLRNPSAQRISPLIKGNSYTKDNRYSNDRASLPPRIHIDQGIGMGLKPVNKGKATEIPAHPWNRQSTLSPIEIPERTLSHTRPLEQGSVNIGVDFTKDTEDHVNEENNNNTDSTTYRMETGTAHSHLLTTQEYVAPPPEVSLEIQLGKGPFSPTVSSPVKIGDNISLVVRAKSQMRGEHSFDMFVHSCFASDGPGSKKIDLIDKNGCVSRPEFVSPLKRMRDRTGIMYYTFGISAFKFPGPDDVYFSCSIDLTPLRNAPEICSTFRRIRSLPIESNLRLFDNVRVELAEKFEMEQRIGTEDEQLCLSSTLLTLLFLFFCTLLLAFTISTVTAMLLYFKLSSLRAKVY